MTQRILASMTLLASLLVTPAAWAGSTIDATAYMPLGAFNAWEMIDRAAWELDGTKAEPQILSVTKTDVVAGVPRYNVRTKFFQDVQDPIFQFGIDGGVLYLYGVRVIDPDQDLGVEDLQVPTVFFDPPVPVGDGTTPLGAPFATTNVTAKVKVKLKIGPKSISGNVFIDGSVTATWNQVGAIDTPLGTLGGGTDPLARLQLDFFFTYSSDDSDIDDEINDKTTDKGVGGVMGPGIGFVLIDGQGSQQKIVNRAILPGELLSSDVDPDAFQLPPSGDLLGFTIDTPEVVSLQDALGLEEGGVTDGTLELNDLQLEHTLGGALLLRATAYAGSSAAEVLLTGKARPNKKTGGLKVSLKGKTKKLDSFAKIVKLSVKQELDLAAGGGLALDVVYQAGKDPETGEPVSGTLSLPIDPFVGNRMSLTVAKPVDVPKVKAGLLSIHPTKRLLGAEGTLTVESAAEGVGMSFPVILLEKLALKEGQPSRRAYTLLQTGTKSKLVKAAATSTGVEDYSLLKFKAKVLGTKIAPAPEEVLVEAQ